MNANQPDCSRHVKEVAGIADMKLLAEIVGDLHYETLKDFLALLGIKLLTDGAKDARGNRPKLSSNLMSAAIKIVEAAKFVKNAEEISRPFMSHKNEGG